MGRLHMVVYELGMLQRVIFVEVITYFISFNGSATSKISNSF